MADRQNIQILEHSWPKQFCLCFFSDEIALCLSRKALSSSARWSGSIMMETAEWAAQNPCNFVAAP